MNPQYNKTLQDQITASLGQNPAIAENLNQLFDAINASYTAQEATITDLNTKIKLRTDQLISSTSSAYSFLDSLNMGFILCDVSAEIVITNEAVKQILSKKMTSHNEESEPKIALDSWTMDQVDELMKPTVLLKEHVSKCLQTGVVIEYKEANYGKRVLHIFIAPMKNSNVQSSTDNQNIGAVILIEDITEQKVLERSKDEFLSLASHELRTPLTAIRGNASMIKKYYGDKLPNTDTIEMIDDIHESAIRLIDIVNDFLDASSLEQGKMHMTPESFQIFEVVNEVVHELKVWAATKGVTFVIDPTVNSARAVYADKHRIKQVLYNLVGNSVKFTDNGTVTIQSSDADSLVSVRVIDTGKGVSPENQQLLFRKFQQAENNHLTRDNTKGTGLGLYISRLIIEQTGGTIQLESSIVGQGSTFVFTLPKPKT